jgi:uncharacterized phosphosugar-binding protein
VDDIPARVRSDEHDRRGVGDPFERMSAADRYLTGVLAILESVAASGGTSIEIAANAIASAIAGGHRVFVAGTSHVLHTELVLRAGGLAAVHSLGDPPDLADPMLALSNGALVGDGTFVPETGDVVLVGTNAGTDAGTVEVALEARDAGCFVVALTSVAYERWPDIVREHPSGQRLLDVADVVIDIGGVVGDGIVRLPGVDTPVAPTSGVVLVAVAWAVLARAAERLVEQGLEPIVYRSVQMPGAEALFRERKGRYEATGVGFTTGKSSSTRTGAPRRSDS